MDLKLTDKVALVTGSTAGIGFAMQFDRLGYGRVEIFTKPSKDTLHGQIESRGNESILNSQNPILNDLETGRDGDSAA